MDLSPDEDNFPGRLIHQAALWDNVELLQELLSTELDVNSKDKNDRTALHAAALAEGSKCLKALCAAGADVNAKSDAITWQKTALHIAAERGHVENMKTLLQYGASPSIEDLNGETVDAGRWRHVLIEATDALERERLSNHAELRDLVLKGDHQRLRHRVKLLGASAGLAVNMTPNGANTLLYVAAEAGSAACVSALLEAGADGRAHPVTRYCPLYIACYHGHADIARLLLAHFPQAVQQETVEKWLPIHAACIGGHASLVTLLLEYKYSDDVLMTYTVSARWCYKAAFDVNARDVSGHTPLYQAVTLGNLPVVEALLNHTTTCTRVEGAEAEDPSPDPAPPQLLSPHRAGISLGIHAIVSKLTGSGSKYDKEEERRVRPVGVEVWCGGDSCVSCAARAGRLRVLRALLAAGAAADSPAAAPPPVVQPTDLLKDGRRRSRSAHAKSSSPSPSRNSYNDREGPWTALGAAARAQQVQAMELLLARGAADPHCVALRECARNGLHDQLQALLATKAYPDPDFKINKAPVSETVFSIRDTDSQLTYHSLCPTTPVMINWRELRCQLSSLRMSWLRSASQRLNPRLGSGRGAAHALTRLDVAHNELRALPAELFTLLSLRYLNAAQNKLERLPTLSDPIDEDADVKGRRRRARRAKPEIYSAPVLQEVYLQDNRLEVVPPELFSLPALTTLDISNNKIRSLPHTLWSAKNLTHVHAQLNHLYSLPTPVDQSEPTTPTLPSPSELPTSPLPNSNSQFNFQTNSKSSSRSPSIERSESETNDDEIPTIGSRAGNTACTSAQRAHTWRGIVEPIETAPTKIGSGLTTLNLSHNQFTCIPAVLACRAPALTTLNMAYNSLRSMSYVTSYPTSLRQLDLSHNEITCWPSLPQLDTFGAEDPLACYCVRGGARAGGVGGAGGAGGAGGSVRAQLLRAACPARRHLRLEGLRTLILANNLLTRIQLTTDDDGFSTSSDGSNDEDDEWGTTSSLKGRMLFPLLSMLDVSCNLIKNIPPAIHELTNLSVFNISGNKEITDLPPQMGLLSRLWSLSTGGCSLQEPLRSMVSGGKCRSVDVIGYLKSVLTHATPYSTMKLMLVGLQGIGKTSLLDCLRQESAVHHRRKPTEHWSKRMGNKSSSSKKNISTVGVDIGCWVYEKMRSNRGPVTFRTWDFGGQQEYYSTHQYFLSRRSLYLVLWKVTDGKKGLAGAVSWLRSIQARAPGSPVIMVATHYDQVDSTNLPENESPEALQRHIRTSIMGAPDADKLGLPRVMDSVEVSCSTKHNIRLLADIIYTIAFSVKPPGSKEPLLEQRVPASYLALEECVTSMAHDLTEPVLRHDEYRKLVTQYMQLKNHRMFRDAAELHQATMFLHENGVLLHYDDATLKELYFLKPQWLCDVLAHVVTVREINPFATNGIMKMEDLAHVFKASPQLGRGEEAISLAVSLLSKFELALCWDGRLLLVPPLLPDNEPSAPQLPLRSRSWTDRGTPRRSWPNNLTVSAENKKSTDSPTVTNRALVMSARGDGSRLQRVLVLSYVPRGLVGRLAARLLADPALSHAAAMLYLSTRELELDEATAQSLELSWSWKVWKSGLQLSSGDITLLALRQIDRDCNTRELNVRFRIRQEGAWCELDLANSSCIEIQVPAPVCVIRREDGLPIAGYQSISLEPNQEILTKVLALVSDHVDLLLEDWYPSLGTRFVHTSEGRCLITRIVPCFACMKEAKEPSQQQNAGLANQQLAQVFNDMDVGERRPRLSEESRASDGDSGVGNESNASSRVGSVEGALSAPPSPLVYGWTVEECILAACTNKPVNCPLHAHVKLMQVAPDTLLLDVEEHKRAKWEHITRSAVVGRGAFGTVLCARWTPPGRRGGVSVALKALQPVPPPTATDIHAQHAYKALLSRWERDATSGACRAYCGLRQELSILSQLQHPHVVQLLAVCCSPLALLLALAPMGALDAVLRSYRGMGARVGARAARAAALQLARALEYLHACRIVYRDLKSENVLVWEMPKPQDAVAAELSPEPIPVHVKLGDYGISRLAPPSGTKGFGGTEGFMAPEIMRYNGEEEYNEKVDCFSFGMLLYEIVTLRQPFEGHEAVKEAVLEGARPSLSHRDLQYPCLVLETMRRCWAAAPALRPSAGALVSVLAAPECLALQDAAAAPPIAPPAAAAAAPALLEEGQMGWEVWYGGGEADRAHTLVATPTEFTHQHTMRIQPGLHKTPDDKDEPEFVTAICRVGNKVWIGDSAGRVSVYSAATCALQWRVRVQDAVGGATCAVTALAGLRGLQRLALALACGRLFLVTSSKPEAEGSFVLTELGTASQLCCLTAVCTDTGVELWAGGDGLYAYVLSAGGVSAADTLATSACAALAADVDQPTRVFVYLTPGVCVYQYSVSTRQQTARLECSKLVPCSESLRTIDIDELYAGHCTVTALCAFRGSLYVGTSWGCLIVADGATLRPITVFRAYEQDVRIISPLPPHPGEVGPGMIATFGTGYRPLLDRFTQQPTSSSNTHNYSGPHCLLWRTGHWLPD